MITLTLKGLTICYDILDFCLLFFCLLKHNLKWRFFFQLTSITYVRSQELITSGSEETTMESPSKLSYLCKGASINDVQTLGE